VTNELVPDERFRVEVKRYLNPRPTKWPRSHFIIGNPPYVGARYIRTTLGDEYVKALRSAYPEVPPLVIMLCTSGTNLQMR
jgi:hypothetical protein